MSTTLQRLLRLVAFLPGTALASHPLITEDTGVLGEGVWQVEVHGDAIDHARDQYAAALSYGVADAADVQVEVPRDGDAVLSVKWRFHEQGPASFALKPDVYDSGWGVSAVAGYLHGRVELLAHAGYARADGQSSRHASAAALWSALPGLKLALDLARDTNPDRDSIVVGAIYELAANLDLGFGRKAGDERAWLLGAKLRW
jgi:hypothetical protein